MQRSSNPSSIKIQMNNFTLNLQTLLSKDHQQLPTTQRKTNKTERRTKSNFEDISPLKFNHKNKDKQYLTNKNKSKKEDFFQINNQVPSKPNKSTKAKKQTQLSKKAKKTEHNKPTEQSSKSKKDKSSRLQRHFTDYDHVIESARLRTSPSQNYNQYNFNSESRSKSRSRSKSYKKITNKKQKSNQKSRSKSIFSTLNNNQRLNTQKSTSKIKKKTSKQRKRQKTSPQEQSAQTQRKKKPTSKSRQRQRKSIDTYKLGKSKSREKIYTQVSSSRHPLDDRHFNSDHLNQQSNEKVFTSVSHKKSKSKFEKVNNDNNLMSNSSQLGGWLGPKFTLDNNNNRAVSKQKGEKLSSTTKKSKKMSGTISSTNIQKAPQTIIKNKQKQKKLDSSKKSKNQSKNQQKQKSLQSQFNFFQSTNIQKKRSTEQDPDAYQKAPPTTSKKSKRLKTQSSHIPSQKKYQPGELSGFKNKKTTEERLTFQKPFNFKKKKNVVDVVERLFNNDQSIQQQAHTNNNPQKYHPPPTQQTHPTQKSSNNNNPQSHHHQNQTTTSSKIRQFPHTRKLTILTDFNQVQNNKQIYFDDISKILLKQQQNSSQGQQCRQSMSRSEKSIKDEVMESRKSSRIERQQNNNRSKQEVAQEFESKLHSEIRQIRAQDLNQSQQQQSQCSNDSFQSRNSSPNQLQQQSHQSSQSQQQQEENSADQLNQLQELNSQLEKIIGHEQNNNIKAQRINASKNSISLLNNFQNNKDPSSSLSSSNNLSIREEASFKGKITVNNNIKQYPKSFTLISENNKKTIVDRSTVNQNPSNNSSVQVKQKKAVSSSLIITTQQNQPTIKSTLCSPSSYAFQNKQKVISSFANNNNNKPRKSIQQKFLIAKTLSNKKLLEELELLDTLEKIEKSVENSLVHQGAVARGYFGIGRGDDNIVEEDYALLVKNYQSIRNNSSKTGQQQQGVKEKQGNNNNNEKPVVFHNSSEQQQSDDKVSDHKSSINKRSNPNPTNEQQLITSTTAIQQQQHPSSSLTPVLQKSRQQTLLLTSQHKKHHHPTQEQYNLDQNNNNNQDSPLLSNNSSNQFKRSPIITHNNNNKTIPHLNTKQLQVNPFLHSYQQIENFFSNNSCNFQNQRREQQQQEKEENQNDRQFEIGNGKILSVQRQNSIIARKKADYSQLTLQFEKQMDDYLKDNNQKISAKSKLQQIKINSHTPPIPPTFPSSNQHQTQYLQKSDQFFYYNQPPSQSQSTRSKSLPSTTSQHPTNNNTNNNNSSQLINLQLTNQIQNRLIKEFCQQLTLKKQILHAFLHFISRCNIIVVGGDEDDIRDDLQQNNPHKQQREINQEKFMEYLQNKIYASNQYIYNLGCEVISFVKHSPEYQQIFLTNINKAFGIQPLKTLKWMRKVYADEQNKTGHNDDQEQQQQQGQEQEQNQQQQQQQQTSISGLSSCQQVQAILPPTLLADFDAYQSQTILYQQLNQQQFYLNHAVYAALNEICDKYRPFGQNGYPVIAKQKPKLTVSVGSVQPKIMKRLNYLLELRWGRILFAPDQQPQKIITETYRKMDEDIRLQDDQRWSQRNMDDTVFENVYYLAKHIIDAIINQEVMEVWRMVER